MEMSSLKNNLTPSIVIIPQRPYVKSILQRDSAYLNTWKKRRPTLCMPVCPVPSAGLPAMTFSIFQLCASHTGVAVFLLIEDQITQHFVASVSQPGFVLATKAYALPFVIFPSQSALAGMMGCHHDCDPDLGGRCYKGGLLCRSSKCLGFGL